MVAESRAYFYVGEKSKKYYTILLKLLKKEGHLCLVDSLGISEETKQFLDINGYHWDLVQKREMGRGDWIILPFGVNTRQFLKNFDTPMVLWVPLHNKGEETINHLQCLKDNLSKNSGVIEGIPLRLVVVNSSSLYT